MHPHFCVDPDSVSVCQMVDFLLWREGRNNLTTEVGTQDINQEGGNGGRRMTLHETLATYLVMLAGTAI